MALSAGLYQVKDPNREIQVSSFIDPSDSNFLGLPYLPFFSNCKGSDSYISFSKLVETDPRCDLVEYENTVAVLPYPWTGTLNPNGDRCNQSTPASLQTKLIDGEVREWLGPYNGALFDCVFEENIGITLTSTRWYEAGPLTTLFYFGSCCILARICVILFIITI